MATSPANAEPVLRRVRRNAASPVDDTAADWIRSRDRGLFAQMSTGERKTGTKNAKWTDRTLGEPSTTQASPRPERRLAAVLTMIVESRGNWNPRYCMAFWNRNHSVTAPAAVRAARSARLPADPSSSAAQAETRARAADDRSSIAAAAQTVQDKAARRTSCAEHAKEIRAPMERQYSEPGPAKSSAPGRDILANPRSPAGP